MTASPTGFPFDVALGRFTPHTRGVVAMVLAALLLSTGGLFIKAVDIDAIGISMWRSAFAGVTIWALMRPRLPLPWCAGWQTWGLAGSYAGMLLFLVISMRLTTAANAIFLQFTAPLYIVVLARFLLDERPSRIDLVTLVAAFVGMALFFVGRFEGSSLAGNLFGLGAGLCFGVLLVLFRLPGVDGPTRLSGVIYGNLVLAAVLVPVNLIRAEPGLFTPGLADLGGLLFMGVVQIGFGYVAMTYGIAHVHALEASLINMLEPVLNPVWVFLGLGEDPGGWAILGGTIIVVAVASRIIITERGRARAPANLGAARACMRP